MSKIALNVIKKVSQADIKLKKNYKIFRALQKIINPVLVGKNSFKDMELELDDRKVKLRVFDTFNESEKLKLIIYLHGGGWVLGSVDFYTNTCIELAKRTKRVVIAIDYRLAPENPFPAGFDDCYDTIKLIMDNLDSMGSSEKDVCLMGDSAGGNLVAAVSLKARNTQDFNIKNQILLYPALNGDYSDNTKYKSVITKGKDFILTQKSLCDYMDMYVKDKKDLNNPYVAPLKAKHLFHQPRTLIITSDLDPLRDEGKAYASRLRLHFNHVKYYNIKDSIHGYFSIKLYKKPIEFTYQKVLEFLND